MNKKKVLVMGEAHYLNSGFGTYTNELLTRLHKTNKYELIELVERNANYELKRIKSGFEKQELAVEDLASLLNLDCLPKRIEGYDISHISGTDPVASQVVFINGLPAKQHYRKYKITSEKQPAILEIKNK